MAPLELEMAQKESVERFFDGADKADATAQLAVMDERASYLSVDGDFNRHLYRGKDEIRAFLTTFFSHARSVSYRIRALASAPDLVMAEWEDTATTQQGQHYENQGVMVFQFVPGTAQVLELRSYFDWRPLLEDAEWREGMATLGETSGSSEGSDTAQ